MRSTLREWINDAGAYHQVTGFGGDPGNSAVGVIPNRTDDCYTALVGELFSLMRGREPSRTDWALIGNALALFADSRSDLRDQTQGVSQRDAALYSGCAFYLGGYPASAYVVVRQVGAGDGTWAAPAELLLRPIHPQSATVKQLVDAVRRGDMALIRQLAATTLAEADNALLVGPDEWIPARLLARLMDRFLASNIRSVLPSPTAQWDRLVSSFLDRERPIWEFFPSQIEAIEGGLLETDTSFSLQMPTGSGKTALCEALLYSHLTAAVPGRAVVVVPYRSLASELRRSLVAHLNEMEISASCLYGGTVPTADEVADLQKVRALVATPEALSGAMAAEASFGRAITLVICDEGHLLDSEGRGVGLELLLARLRSLPGRRRFVFLSAIVPNVEEINAWLGGSDGTVVRSRYRPAAEEFARLSVRGSGVNQVIDLDVNPHPSSAFTYVIRSFLAASDFRARNPATGRDRTYQFTTYKTRAVAAGRKCLGIGPVAVFAAIKRGHQGAIGVAEELLKQILADLPLPIPMDFVRDQSSLEAAADYLEREYGVDWIGSRTLRAGAVLHHGDIPQESREVVEELLQRGAASMAICTSTLAEGVNLPIATIVLYSIERRSPSGVAETMLSRDVKNLIGRAGRAGQSTKSLVICVNPSQWPVVERVAEEEAVERVEGALLRVCRELGSRLALETMSNTQLERTWWLMPLVDGVDAMLVDLAAEELGERDLELMAADLAKQTFAARTAEPADRHVLEWVLVMRAQRISELSASGGLRLLRQAAARPRLFEVIRDRLLPVLPRAGSSVVATDRELIAVLVKWAWRSVEFQRSLQTALRRDEVLGDREQSQFEDVVLAWLSGRRFAEIEAVASIGINDLLSVHAGCLSYSFQTLVEQGVSLADALAAEQGELLHEVVRRFPECLKYGVSTEAGRLLASHGVRHRAAAVALGREVESGPAAGVGGNVFDAAEMLLVGQEPAWRSLLGDLVFDHTVRDLRAIFRERR